MSSIRTFLSDLWRNTPVVGHLSSADAVAIPVIAPSLAQVADHGISLGEGAAQKFRPVDHGGELLEIVPLAPPPVDGEGAGTKRRVKITSARLVVPPPLPPSLETESSPVVDIDDETVAESVFSPQRVAGGLNAAAAEPAEASLVAECWAWMRGNLHWYAISTAVHLGLFAIAVLVMGELIPPETSDPAEDAAFQPADYDHSVSDPLAHFEMPRVDPDRAPSALDAAALRQPESRSVKRQYNDNSPDFSEEGGGRSSADPAHDLGGAGGFAVLANTPGPKYGGRGGIEDEFGHSKKPGRGGSGEGFGHRHGHSDGLRVGGGTRDTEISVAMALYWFMRHRNTNGSWSLSRFGSHCTGPTPCSGPGSAESDAAATALALLPFLGAGETHTGRGPYHDAVRQGLFFLKGRQSANGDLSGGSGHQMYAHALATLTLCEAYGMTKDPKIGDAAQHGINFIEAAQNRQTGGWRYVPGDPTGGDTSVLGWQMMALRSGQLAGLSVSTQTMENAKKWLAVVSKGSQHGLYSYQPFKDATPTMTAIGMLSWQYLGMRPDDPTMIEGKTYLMENLPDNRLRNTYYWYYATQVMHNFLDPKWDTWNRAMRRALLESQMREGCATGSWDPESPTLDAWSEQGGRIVTTAFSTLSLEVYYRYMPIYNRQTNPSPDPLPTPEITAAPTDPESP